MFLQCEMFLEELRFPSEIDTALVKCEVFSFLCCAEGYKRGFNICSSLQMDQTDKSFFKAVFIIKKVWKSFLIFFPIFDEFCKPS